MIYTDLNALALAALSVDLENPSELKAMQELLRVYFDALHNPPLGCIGVGAISYAEACLVSYQINTNTKEQVA